MISIEIDERPLSLDIPNVPDYIGRMILGALHRPLLRWDAAERRVEPALAASFEQSQDGGLLRLHISEDARWSNGRRITSTDALRGLSDAAAHPFWCRFLNILESADAENDQILALFFSRPLGYIQPLLTVPDLAPKPGDRPYTNVSSGPLVIVEHTDESIELDAAPNLPPDQQPVKLRFIVNRDPAMSLRGFRERRWDVTSPTGVAPGYLEQARGGARRKALTGIFLQMEFPPRGRLFQEAELRQALSLALDTDECRRTYPSGVRVGSSLGPKCFDELDAQPFERGEASTARALWRRNGGPTQLKIGFTPYYPNIELLEVCGDQWQRTLGMQIVPLSFPFGSKAPECCDAVLALRFPAFPHPWSVLDQALRLAVVSTGSRDLWIDAARWLREETAEALSTLLRGLEQAMPVVPLGEIVGQWLERDTVMGFDLSPYATISLTEMRLRI